MAAALMPWTDDLRIGLHNMDEIGEKYWTAALEAPGVEHVCTVHLSEHSWYTRKLDVYRRKADGAVAGVVWDCPATEEQEGQERNALVVEVEEYTSVNYRVRRAGE